MGVTKHVNELRLNNSMPRLPCGSIAFLTLRFKASKCLFSFQAGLPAFLLTPPIKPFRLENLTKLSLISEDSGGRLKDDGIRRDNRCLYALATP